MKAITRLVAACVALVASAAASSQSSASVVTACHWVHTVEVFSCNGNQAGYPSYCYSIMPQTYKDQGCCTVATECHAEDDPKWYDCSAQDGGTCPAS